MHFSSIHEQINCSRSRFRVLRFTLAVNVRTCEEPRHKIGPTRNEAPSPSLLIRRSEMTLTRIRFCPDTLALLYAYAIGIYRQI